MGQLPELIVHIGAGKTGSKSIQTALRLNDGALADGGAVYLGIGLENVPGAPAGVWDVRRRADKSRPDSIRDVEAALRTELARLADRGITRAVWSNEGFLVQKGGTLRLLERLADDGIRVRPVVYVRRHDARAVSAFREFEIKAKRHRGGLLPFRDWIDGWAPRLSYADHVADWAARLPVEVYNYDVIDDVARHFTRDLLGLDGIEAVRANVGPPAALMTAWTVYADREKKPTWPWDFLRLAEPLGMVQRRAHPRPVDLLPDDDDIRRVRDRFREDLEGINAQLAAQGQPPLAFADGPPPTIAATDWEMQQMLVTAALTLQAQVLDLQAEVGRLRDRIDHLEGSGSGDS